MGIAPRRRAAAGVAAALLLGLALLLPAAGSARAVIPPLKVDIFDAQKRQRGRAFIYPNFVELQNGAGNHVGSIGVVWSNGRVLLFLVGADAERRMIGWAEDHKLYTPDDKLAGYYFWTPIWSYVYDPDMKKLGQAQCLAYQGVCAAGIAGYLLGLM